MEGRLFTFGCSFTRYFYPTWADFIGMGFGHYENWGRAGAGNFYIASQLFECHQVNKIQKEDTVLIMMSSIDRFDFIDWNSEIVTNGCIYTNPRISKRFVEDMWSWEQGIYSSWMYINSIKNLLEGIGCRYKIMYGFDIESLDDGKIIEVNTSRVKNCIESLNEIYSGISLSTYDSIKRKEKDMKLYYFKDYNDYDQHPTIKTHLNWVKDHLPEYYKDEYEEYVDRWESLIGNTLNRTSINFSTILNKLPIKTFQNTVTTKNLI